MNARLFGCTKGMTSSCGPQKFVSTTKSEHTRASGDRLVAASVMAITIT